MLLTSIRNANATEWKISATQRQYNIHFSNNLIIQLLIQYNEEEKKKKQRNKVQLMLIPRERFNIRNY